MVPAAAACCTHCAQCRPHGCAAAPWRSPQPAARQLAAHPASVPLSAPHHCCRPPAPRCSPGLCCSCCSTRAATLQPHAANTVLQPRHPSLNPAAPAPATHKDAAQLVKHPMLGRILQQDTGAAASAGCARLRTGGRVRERAAAGRRSMLGARDSPGASGASWDRAPSCLRRPGGREGVRGGGAGAGRAAMRAGGVQAPAALPAIVSSGCCCSWAVQRALGRAGPAIEGGHCRAASPTAVAGSRLLVAPARPAAGPLPPRHHASAHGGRPPPLQSRPQRRHGYDAP